MHERHDSHNRVADTPDFSTPNTPHSTLASAFATMWVGWVLGIVVVCKNQAEGKTLVRAKWQNGVHAKVRELVDLVDLVDSN